MTATEQSKTLPISLIDLTNYLSYAEQGHIAILNYIAPSIVLSTEENREIVGYFRQSLETPSYVLNIFSTFPREPVVIDTAADWFLFQTLREEWYRERGATSSITRMALCPAYQKMIAIGPQVMPHILRQLESEGDEPDMWFWALKVLTQGYDPVRESDRGDFRAMAKAWVAWGRTRYAR